MNIARLVILCIFVYVCVHFVYVCVHFVYVCVVVEEIRIKDIGSHNFKHLFIGRQCLFIEGSLGRPQMQEWTWIYAEENKGEVRSSVENDEDHLVILGLGVGLCGYEDGWSGQFVPQRFSGSVDREWWLLLEICLCCFSMPVCTVQLLLSCWIHRFLHPCEQMSATSLCHVQSAPKCWCWCWRPSTRLLVHLCSAFSGLLGSTSLVVHHRTVS